MEGLKVQIIHGEMDSGDYVLLSSFLRINGIVVDNAIIREDDSFISFPCNYDYDFCVVIKNNACNVNEKSIVDIADQYINSIKYSRLIAYCKENGYEKAGTFLESTELKNSVIIMDAFHKAKVDVIFRIDYLRKFVENMKKADLCRVASKQQKPEFWQYLFSFAEIYGRNNLLRYRVALYSLYHRKDIVGLVQKNFLNAISEVEKKEQEFSSVPQLTFFKIYAARFVNETCNLLDQPQMFNTEICVNTLRVMISNPDCESINDGKINYLIATFFNTDRNRRRESLEYFEKANNELDGRQYGARSLYQTARFYEKNYKDFDQAEELYLKAHKSKPRDYKILYKLAAMATMKDHYDVAVMYYKQILDDFDNKKKENRLEPREYEYLFKTNHQLAYIYKNYLKDAIRADKYSNECKSVIRLADDIDNSNSLYEQIYGSESWGIDNSNPERFIRDLTSNRISRM